MHKSNTISEKLFDNNNGNIKTIENLPQAKISDSSVILYLQHWEIAAKQGQISLIKFVESNEFNNVYSNIWSIFAWSNFLKKYDMLYFIKLVE